MVSLVNLSWSLPFTDLFNIINIGLFFIWKNCFFIALYTAYLSRNTSCLDYFEAQCLNETVAFVAHICGCISCTKRVLKAEVTQSGFAVGSVCCAINLPSHWIKSLSLLCLSEMVHLPNKKSFISLIGMSQVWPMLGLNNKELLNHWHILSASRDYMKSHRDIK